MAMNRVQFQQGLSMTQPSLRQTILYHCGKLFWHEPGPMTYDTQTKTARHGEGRAV